MVTLKAIDGRKVIFPTNDRTYPTLIKRDDDSYVLLDREGTLTGDGFYDDVDVLKHFPNADLT
jgi:hypothetical protein